MIEALLGHESEQVLEVLLGFAGEAHDEGGAQHRLWQLLADPLQQATGHAGLPGTVHRPQHIGMAVLQRQIQVRQHVGHLPIGRQHLGGEAGGVGVMHADPGDLHRAEGAQQFRELGPAVEVEAVVGGDLADQHQLLHPLGRQLARLGQDAFDRARTLVAAQVGNDAEGAAVVATLGHLEVGHRLTGGAIAGQVLIGHEGGHGAHLVHPLAGLHPFQHAHDVLVIAGAHDRLCFRQGVEQLLLEVLGQASSNNELLALLGQFHQGAHRFLAGVLDEAARVHHHHGGLAFIGAHAVAGLGEQAEHVFGVDSVLFAAQMGESHGGFGRRLGHVHGDGLRSRRCADGRPSGDGPAAGGWTGCGLHAGGSGSGRSATLWKRRARRADPVLPGAR